MKVILIRDCFFVSLFIFILITFTGCGKEHHTSNHVITQEVIQDDMDAIYFFPMGGSVEVTQDQYERLTFTMLDYLTSINPENETLGEHPRTTISDRFLTENKSLYYSTNVNYGSGDLEEDENGNNITGSKRTDFIYKFENNQLKLTIKIYESSINNNINSVIAERTFVGEK